MLVFLSLFTVIALQIKDQSKTIFRSSGSVIVLGKKHIVKLAKVINVENSPQNIYDYNTGRCRKCDGFSF